MGAIFIMDSTSTGITRRAFTRGMLAATAALGLAGVTQGLAPQAAHAASAAKDASSSTDGELGGGSNMGSSGVYDKQITNAPGHPDTLTAFVGTEPEDGFDPLTGWGAHGAFLFQSCLLSFDTKLSIVPDLATSFDVSDDGLTYTYHLRDGVKFSDGTDLTADDVVFSYLTARDNGASTLDWTGIADAKALDATTVEFTLKDRDATFPARTGKQGIVPKASYDAQSYRENPVGSGPFKLLQWDKGQQIIIEPNEYYYGTKSPFKQISLLFIDGDTALANAQSGQLDVVMVQPEYAKSTVEGMPLQTFRTLDTRGFNLPTTKLTTDDKGKQYGNDVTADKAIREAMCIGVSRQAIIDGALNGIGTPSTAMVTQVAWANTDCQYQDGRVDEAKKILDDAGWKEGADGVREKDGVKAEFAITGRADDIQRYNVAVAFAQEAAKLGIKIDAQSQQWDKAKSDAGYIPTCWGTGDYDPSGDLPNYYGTTGLYNFSHYSNATTDQHIKEAKEATDFAAQMQAWKDVQFDGQTGPESDKGDFPYIWLCTIDHTYFIKDGLSVGEQRVHPHGHGWPIAQTLNEWHWEK